MPFLSLISLCILQCSMLQNDEIRKADSYAAPKKAGNKLANYMWSWLSPTKPLTRLPAGRYVLVSDVEAGATELANKISASPTDVFTLEQLCALATRPPADVLLMLQHLQQSGSLEWAEAHPSAGGPQLIQPPLRVFKFGASTASATDHSRATLQFALGKLRAHAQQTEALIAEKEAEAKKFLLRKQRQLALLQLQTKKSEHESQT
jgi:hypothetical protein